MKEEKKKTEKEITQKGKLAEAKKIAADADDKIVNNAKGKREENNKQKQKTSNESLTTKKSASEVSQTKCEDKRCHVHGNLKSRGRTFEGKVIKKFHKRIVIEFERMIYVRKYERYAKSRTKIHARLPECMEKEIEVGDLVKIQECRPLSKIIHSVVIKKVKGREEK